MKKIINGKVYDTDTAKRLAGWDNGIYGALESVSETLYRKKTGEYFVHGEGGAMTQYASPKGQNSWAGGERIMPMAYDDAKAWAEERLTAAAYEELFGTVAEDGTRTVVTYSIAAASAETIRRRASELGISSGEYIDRLVGVKRG